MAERDVDDVDDPEERSIEGEAADSGRPVPSQRIADAFIPRHEDSEEGEESGGPHRPTAANGGAESESATRLSFEDLDSTASVREAEPTVVDDVPPSSARPSDSSLTVVERKAPMNRGRPTTREAREDANSDGSMTTTTTADVPAEAETEAQLQPQVAGDEESGGGPSSTSRAELDNQDASSSLTPSHPDPSALSPPSTPFGLSDSVSASESSSATIDADPEMRLASLPPAPPTVEHEASIPGQWPCSEAQDIVETATTRAANAEVDTQPRPVEENGARPAGAVAVGEPPLNTMSEAPRDSVQDQGERAEQILAVVKKQNVWTRIPGAIVASGRSIAQRVVKYVWKYHKN
ncbi:hypothetical protein GSI_09880 [Ganoderma sinense ZZ0214-1]|uniref:Uncharacterized protein n=1 Tax=Ganoderma sinense ZZ0214-1 TaxID=1077348 RepID=A0A2G8S2M7_9APHY|nr:hypothetical protein GSI_09880 [Ganoderma sinense ZZ0214-1]